MLRRRSTRASAPIKAAAGQTRREFLRNSGLAGLTLASLGGPAGRVVPVQAARHVPAPGTTFHKTICQFCSVGCSLWAEVQNGVWVGQEPAFESPINQGTHCAKGAAMREIAIGERRLNYPMKKVAGEWTRINWDQAIAELGEKLLGIREQYGPDSVYWLGSAKYSNDVDPRFTRTAAHADEYVRIRPGADIGFIWGLVREIFANGWEDAEYIRQRVWGIDQIRQEAERRTLEEVERVSGIPAKQTARVARTIVENRPGTLIRCMGLTQSTSAAPRPGRRRYLRPRALPMWPYNLFAMVHASSHAEVEARRGRIAVLLGPCCHRSDVLYSTRILKKTGLRLKARGGR